MALVKIKRFAQVTLPPDIRKRFSLSEGDYLEAEAVEKGILLKPVTVVERKEVWNRLFGVLSRVDRKASKFRRSKRVEEEEFVRLVKDFRKRRDA